MNFYQPFCGKNNVSESQRLYYHYYFYGTKNDSQNLSKFHNFEIDNRSIQKLFGASDQRFKVSYCSTLFDRHDSLLFSLNFNLSRKKNDEQIVLVDYNNNYRSSNYIKSNFLNYIKSGDLKYIHVLNQKFYNCPVAKNIAHYYSDGEYIVNLDIDNTLLEMREQIDEQISIQSKSFLLHMAVLKEPFSKNSQAQLEGYSGTFGRICMHRDDFLSLGGYNESFMPIGYQDTDIILRSLNNGFKYFNRPVFQKPSENPKYITYSSDDSIFNWEDCRNYNFNLSEYNLQNGLLVSPNLPKKLEAVLNLDQAITIDYSNTSQKKLNFNIDTQVNPPKGSNPIDAFLDYDFRDHESLIDFYIKNVLKDILKQKPEKIELAKQKLRNNIIDYAQKKSLMYKSSDLSSHLLRSSLPKNPDQWVCKNISSSRILKQNTSGSSSGTPLNYYNDKKYFNIIQDLSEFEIIRSEYKLPHKNIKVLSLLDWPSNPDFDNFYLDTENFEGGNPFNSFGVDSFSTTFVNFSSFQADTDLWFKNLFNLLSDRFFDVTLSSGSVISYLSKYSKKYKFNHKSSFLLTNSTEPVNLKDLKALRRRGNIEYFCDHMRGWDGGFTFFSCEYGTYHLHEGVSDVVLLDDNRVSTTCFFNLVSPFINYINGDICELSSDYKLCKCGRYYRPFKMLSHRPFGRNIYS